MNLLVVCLGHAWDFSSSGDVVSYVFLRGTVFLIEVY